MFRVIIIAEEWSTRAYLGAQLKEEGFDARGSPDVIDAIRQLREWKIESESVVIDTRDQDINQETLDILNRLCPQARLILIQGTLNHYNALKWKARIFKLSRPVTIGQIIEKVKELLTFDHNGLSDLQHG